jgi:hypothetical protein
VDDLADATLADVDCRARAMNQAVARLYIQDRDDDTGDQAA